MNRIERIIKRIKSGGLEEIITELAWIYNYGLRYKRQILWYIILGIIGIGMGLCGSVATKYVIDAVTNLDSGTLIPAAVFYIVMRLLQIGINAWTNHINAKISIKVHQEIHADVYEKVMNADWESMCQYHSGDILNRVDNDVSTIAESVLGWVPDFITQLVQFCATLGIILYYDPTLAVLALLSAPVTLSISRVVTKKLRKHNMQIREISSEVMVFNEESFQNIQVLKSFGLTEMYYQKLRQIQQKYRNAKLDFNRFSVRAFSFMSLVGMVVTIVCFGWGVYRLSTGFITYGTMMLFLQLSGSLAASFSALVRMVPSAISAATAAGRVMVISELPSEDHSNDSLVEAFIETNRDVGVSIVAQNLNFSYQNSETVLENVSFAAEPGEIVALVGPSGEGKTTILRLILGIINPSKGVINIHGAKDGGCINVSPSTRRVFAYVPQGNTMFSGTVADNMRLVKPDASDEEIYEVLKLACADKFIRRLPDGLGSTIKEMGGGFSQGQIQRLSIARALLANAPILLLDEATSALDIATERQVLRNIMNSQYRRTCIVTTHRPSVLGICNRVYRISDKKMSVVTSSEIEHMMMDF